jgi:diaminohydroxyphosphoribosylaminopyrimidine deaminase/5-amino-6-(5-phosphoribosylamino)uracil reductase
LEDPDPKVSGRGFARLQDAGVEVIHDATHLAHATALNIGFLTHRTLGRPHLSLKLATSLDGKIAMASGESRWITGLASYRVVVDRRIDQGGVR